MSREESLFEAMGGTYRSVDGILYPNISFLQERMILETDDEGECLDIGKYGLIWISFMKEIHPDRYCHHIRMGELYIKAQEVNEEAYAMLDTIMNQYLANSGGNYFSIYFELKEAMKELLDLKFKILPALEDVACGRKHRRKSKKESEE